MAAWSAHEFGQFVRRCRWVRRLACGHRYASHAIAAPLALVLAGTLAPVSPEPAGEVPVPAAVRRANTSPVRATPVSAKPRPADLSQGAGRRPHTTSEWPAAGMSEVDIGAGAARAGTLPVWLGPPAAAPGAATRGVAVSRARVRVVDREQVPAAWQSGMLLRVDRADRGSGAGWISVGVDYSGFVGMFGGGWASRLRLMVVPDCAFTSPADTGCRARPLASRNDAATHRLSADVFVGDAAGPEGTLLALMAGASGEDGDYGATPLQASSTWSAGGSSGDFAWAYPVRVPPSLGGPAPAVSLAYSSSSVDGRSEVSNNQPSSVGEGFEYSPGYIERRYMPCGDDMGSGANNATETGDLCWGTDNAVLSLNGRSTELVRDGATGVWRAKTDDASRIERPDDTTNPADNTVNGAWNNEYWRVTTADGTQYFFGRNRLTGWTSGKPTTNSVWTVPVAGNHGGERCHQTVFINSFCGQAWRWNLDYVVDPHGNTMSQWYTPHANSYARNLTDTDDVDYHRGGVVDRIDYGTDNRSGTDTAYTATMPPMRVVFTPGDRCLSDCGIHDEAHWPDTPWDQYCNPSATECPGDYTPTFWSTTRLAKITTKVWNPAAVPPAFRDIDSWTLSHTFPLPGDGTRAGLWLESIVHTGHIGGTPLTLPEINFDWVQMANRVDTAGDSKPPMNWMRMSTIWTETGAKISVTYTGPDCIAGSRMPSAPHTNTLRCYPVLAKGAGGTTDTEYFHKYLVSQVTEADWTGGGDDKVTKFEYPGTPAWRHTDDDGLTKDQFRTWSDYRGYDRVLMRAGPLGQETLTETIYARGMHGDKAAPSGGTRTVVLPAIDINHDGDAADAADAPAVNDENTYAATIRRQTIHNGVETDPVSTTVNQPWQSGPTASRDMGDTWTYARYSGIETIWKAAKLDHSPWWRVSRKQTVFDALGVADHVTDFGDTAVAGDEQCEDTTYARNPTLNLLALTARVQVFALPCGTAPVSQQDIVSDVRTSYDGNAYFADGQTGGTAPTKGDVTRLETLRDWSAAGGGTTTWLTTARNSYDGYGRLRESWDVRNNKTTTDYTPVTGGPVTKETTTNQSGWQSARELEPAWGAQIASVEVTNNKRTDLQYDALGRLSKVWLANRPKVSNPTSPSIEHSYLIRNAGGVNAVTTRKLNAEGGYLTTFTLYDGLLRERQIQAAAVAGGGTVFTETVYDSAGRTARANKAHYDPGLTPSTNLVTILEWEARAQTVTLYDRAGRVTVTIFKSAGAELWRTTTAYGGDRTYTNPPLGETPTTTVTDVRGHTVERRQHSGGSTVGPFTATTYEYDRKNQLAAVVDDDGNRWTYGYDIRGRQTSVDDPDKGLTTSDYNDLGDLTATTDARGERLVHEYDLFGRLVGVYDDTISTTTRRATWTFDTLTNAKGKLASASRWDGPNRANEYKVRVRGYTDLYQSTGEDYIIPTAEMGLNGTYTFTRSYKTDGTSPATLVFPSAGGLGAETLTYTYDTVTGLPEQMKTGWTGAGQYVTDTNYTAFGEPEFIEYKMTGGNYLHRSFGYDDATRRLDQSVTTRQIAPTAVADVHYTHDAAGNVTKIVDTPVGGTSDTQCFSYDHTRRLTGAWTPSSGACTTAPSLGDLGGPAPYWSTWTFDGIGNRTTEVWHAAGGDTTATSSHPNPGADRPHAVSSVTITGPGAGTRSYGYDLAGNTVARPSPTTGNQTLAWDAEGHLANLIDNGQTYDYLYDADGNRLIGRDSTGKTLYLPGMELRYTTSGGTKTATRFYTHNGTISAMRQPGTGITWLVSDSQGTQQLAIAAGNQAVVQRRQTPYGGSRGAQPAWPNKKGFVGGDNDPSGLVHLGAREYDPGLGRFVSVDPLIDFEDPQQMHGYSYANNNPTSMTDPDGRIAYLDDEYFGTGVPKPKVVTPCTASTPSACNFDNGNRHTTLGEKSLDHDFAVTLRLMDLQLQYRVWNPFERRWELPEITVNRPENLITGASGNRPGSGPGYADIICWNCAPGKIYIWEVKPDSEYGHRDGPKDVQRYVHYMREALKTTNIEVEAGPPIVPSPHGPVPMLRGRKMITVFSGGPGEEGVEYYHVDEPEKDNGAVREDPLADAVVSGIVAVALVGCLAAFMFAPVATATTATVALIKRGDLGLAA